MEHFGADPAGQCPADKCREAVRQADVYVGIFGMRYGSRDPETGYSMTEVELREAEARADMPMLIYVLSRTAKVQVADYEADEEGRRRLDALLARLKARYVVYQFESVQELAMPTAVNTPVLADANRIALPLCTRAGCANRSRKLRKGSHENMWPTTPMFSPPWCQPPPWTATVVE